MRLSFCGGRSFCGASGIAYLCLGSAWEDAILLAFGVEPDTGAVAKAAAPFPLLLVVKQTKRSIYLDAIPTGPVDGVFALSGPEMKTPARHISRQGYYKQVGIVSLLLSVEGKGAWLKGSHAPVFPLQIQRLKN